MARLEDLRIGAQVKGILPGQRVTVASVSWHGADALTLIYTSADGRTGAEVLYRSDERRLDVISAERRWALTGDGAALRLVSEAYRIHLAHLFDPMLAVHTSMIEPLPHQITAVYEEMLTRQPLRYLLADDPGAGKTIMAGLLIKELVIRGDVHRCLICVPGNLTEQWYEELRFRFQLHFDVLTRVHLEGTYGGNPFDEKHFVIVRLDQISRSDQAQGLLRQAREWDLVICDEAHKLSASFFAGELKETRRYKLGRLLSAHTRHFLLMTATPHNGKEEDFQLFMALLDADRFEGRFREGASKVETSDLMRRMVKEQLRKFDSTPLFPERRANTVDYELSQDERHLYEAVTAYVRDQFNRADQLQQSGRRGTVGFALTVMQRRLASSPEAIYQSIQRRRKRLEKRLEETRNAQLLAYDLAGTVWEDDAWDDIEDVPEAELEALEEEVVDSATAARTIAELEAEIEALRQLEAQAAEVRRRGTDRKWEQLANLMLANEHMVAEGGARHKLVIFTEHRDTLYYLQQKIGTLLGSADMLTVIHGGMTRAERREAEEQFRSNPDVVVLLATDAAGEGINLQRAHLMVNYDLPWNPNRLEQRFGRIHRIGQTEVCHLWNLVAGETREGHVYQRLLSKLENERKALNGQVFDVLGKLFAETPLRDLLVEAIRYGDQPEVRARLEQAIDNALDQQRVRELLEQRSLAQQVLDTGRIAEIRIEMERAAAQRLQPYYIKSFFLQAFQELGGAVHEREPGRYQISRVPGEMRSRAREMAVGGAISTKYERVTFDKSLVNVTGKPPAALVCPGHPLLDAAIALVLERNREVLQEGAVLVDETDPGQQPRFLFYLLQSIHDAVPSAGDKRVISQRLHFVEIDATGDLSIGGSAPYLDYRPATQDEAARVQQALDAGWFDTKALEQKVLSYAIAHLIPDHLNEVRERRLALIAKTEAAVHERLTKESLYWDRRARELLEQERAGKVNARLNSQKAQQRADELIERLKKRMAELAQEKHITAAPPAIVGGALIVPLGMLYPVEDREALDRRITEQIAMRAVLEAEIRLGHDPRDVSAHKVGYDIESRDRHTGRLRLIEVKGRRAGAETVTLTYNELYRALNSPESFILALVEVDNATARPPRYVQNYPFREPDPLASSVNFNLRELLSRSEEPR